MYIDAQQLVNFYSSSLGGKVKKRIFKKISSFLRPLAGEVWLGMDYALPYFDQVKEREGLKCALAFMSMRQGAVQAWPHREESCTAIVDPEMLPLAESSVDKILLIHCLEFSKNPHLLLEELARVLKTQGEMVIIVPNRLGIWAHAEGTPFGYGVPYSQYQLLKLLHQCNFSVESLHTCLHFSPYKKGFFNFFWKRYSYLLAQFLPFFGGVWVAHVKKQIWQGQKVPQWTVYPELLSPLGVGTACSWEAKSSYTRSKRTSK